MARFRLPRPFAAITVASAVACGTDPIVLCACSMPAPYAILYGFATGPSGQVVPGTSVSVQVGPPDCQGGSVQSGATDQTGRYRTFITATGDYPQQCIRVWALAPAGSGFRNSDTVQLTLPTPRTADADSVRRDIALRAP
jgi:hypothetical protein